MVVMMFEYHQKFHLFPILHLQKKNKNNIFNFWNFFEEKKINLKFFNSKNNFFFNNKKTK